MLPPDAKTRFWAKVKKTPKCWMWTGAVQGGYAGFTHQQTKLYGHRVSWEEHNGPIPPGLKVLHKCDTPLCVRPSHLFLGTSKTNSEDMVRKGRSPRGERQGRSVLTDKIVLELRRLYVPRHRKYGCHGLARRYKVSPMAVSRAIRKQSWKHL